MKILLVDPEDKFCSATRSLLKDQGYEYLEVNGVNELLVNIFDQPVAAVAIGHYLYNASLEATVKIIRSTEGLEALPIYLVTETEQIGIARQSYAVGFTEVYNCQELNLLSESFERIHHFHNKVHEGKVLYVEANDAKAEDVLTVLNGIHLRVFHYKSVEKALDVLNHTHFDLIITSLIAGGELTGQYMIRCVRNHINVQKKRIPIIVLSGLYDSARQIECFNLGADDYVQKDCIKHELLPRVSSVLSKSELISGLKQQAKILQRFAIYDSLSNLYNRRGLMEVAPSIIREAFTQQLPLSLLIIDLDYFKEINDFYGHTEGDNVIKAVSKIFMSNLKEIDIPARWGGDEFVVLLPNCDLAEARTVGERLLLKIRGIRPDSNLSCSIGVVQSNNKKIESIENLVDEADKALYRAKGQGRSRVETRQLLSETRLGSH